MPYDDEHRLRTLFQPVTPAQGAFYRLCTHCNEAEGPVLVAIPDLATHTLEIPDVPEGWDPLDDEFLAGLRKRMVLLRAAQGFEEGFWRPGDPQGGVLQFQAPPETEYSAEQGFSAEIEWIEGP